MVPHGSYSLGEAAAKQLWLTQGLPDAATRAMPALTLVLIFALSALASDE
jgi:hypothetical protein